MINIKKSMLLSSVLMTGCLGGNNQKEVYYPVKQCSNQESVHTKYQKCDLTDIKDYYDVVIDNSAKSNKVILLQIGGPTHTSFGETLKEILKTNSTKYDYSPPVKFAKYLQKEGISLYLFNQSQFLKQKKFKYGNLDKLTYEQGYSEHLETVNKTHEVIKHLKNKGKKVGLAGGSYGSFVVNEYLAKYGDDTPNFVISYSGRLKIGNADKLEAALKVAFTKNRVGIKIGKNDVIDDAANKEPASKVSSIIQKNQLQTQFKLGMKGLVKDYTKVIVDKSLNKTTFVTAEGDGEVGSFNQQELTWARSKYANILVHTKSEAQKAFDKFFPAKPNPSVEDQAKRAIFFANYIHNVTMWNEEQIKKYYLDPFKN